MKYFDKYAGRLYLDFLVARSYPQQEPAYENAKWYDLLWLLIPIVGFLFFIAAIQRKTVKHLKKIERHT